MAKLNPKDPQFGIPVATRIPKHLADRFNQAAEEEHQTLSRYIAEFIESAVSNIEYMLDLETRLGEVGDKKRLLERELLELKSNLAKEQETIIAKDKLAKGLQIELLEEKEAARRKESKIKELDAQLIKEKEFAKKVAGNFILKISAGDKKQTTQLIETYNTILKDERQYNG